jgi:hypothetical protein
MYQRVFFSSFLSSALEPIFTILGLFLWGELENVID